MRKSLFVVFLLTILIAMIAVGCSSSNENDQNNEPNVDNANDNELNDNNNDDNSVNTNNTDNNNENNNNNTNNNGDNSDVTRNNDNNNNNEEENESSEQDNSDNTQEVSLPDPIEVDERQQHPNGTILTVEKVSFEEDYISVEFTAQNGFDHSIKLATFMDKSNDLGALLEDDTGFDYRYLPGDNEYLAVENGERMSGSISFIGRLDEDATSLTLRFNPDHSEDDPSEFNPKFTFEIDIDK